MDKLKEVVKPTEEVVNNVVKPAYRYICDACTGVAFYLHKDEIAPKSAVCKVCNKAFVVKKENFVKL